MLVLELPRRIRLDERHRLLVGAAAGELAPPVPERRRPPLAQRLDVGGALLGLWGMLIAIPVVATLKILLVHYWDTRTMWPPRPAEPPDIGEGDPVPPPEIGAEPTQVRRRWWSRVREPAERSRS